MIGKLLNSNVISHLIYLPKVDEPDSSIISDIQNFRVFVGNSQLYSMPVMIDFNKLLNPHILIVGMTGSGKTFLTKNLILRISLLEGSRVILIDLTGEYQNRIKMRITPPEDTKLLNCVENEITYFNLVGRTRLTKLR